MIGRTVAAAVCLLAATGAMAATAPAADKTSTPSPFLLCDGRKGHVGALELMMQLAVITATAGVGGAAFGDGGTTRLDGRPGVDACNAAIAQEGNPGRRVELGLARSIHLIEAGDLPAALASAREIDTLAGPLTADIGYRHSQGASALFLQADILARMGRAAEAEDAALQSAAAAPYDVVNMKRAAAYTLLTPMLPQAKRDYALQFGRIFPLGLITAAQMHCWAGDYRAAAAAYAAAEDNFSAMFPDYSGLLASAPRAVLLAMAGDKAAAATAAAETRTRLDKVLADGGGTTDGDSVRDADEYMAFYDVIKLFDEGRTGEARAAFASRTRWLAPAAPVVADLLTRLRAGAPPAALTGALAADPAKLRADALAARLRAPSVGKDTVSRLYVATAYVERTSSYSNAAPAVWKIGAKPRFLVRGVPKPPATYEIVSANGRILSLASGDAVLLHSALIARSRGKTGFALAPTRKAMDSVSVRFGNLGDKGFDPLASFDTARVIADISAYMPEPMVR